MERLSLPGELKITAYSIHIIIVAHQNWYSSMLIVYKDKGKYICEYHD